jgi:hypothetical protein
MMRSLLIFLLFALAFGAAPEAHAGKVRDLLGQVQDVAIADGRDRQDLRATQSNGPTLSEAVQMVKRQYKGKIVSAETRMSGNREVHHIRVLTEDGKVKTVKIQGRSRQP